MNGRTHCLDCNGNRSLGNDSECKPGPQRFLLLVSIKPMLLFAKPQGRPLCPVISFRRIFLLSNKGVNKMEVKHFKCRLWSSDLERFRLICKLLDISMAEMCGVLIAKFNLQVHEEFNKILEKRYP